MQATEIQMFITSPMFNDSHMQMEALKVSSDKQAERLKRTTEVPYSNRGRLYPPPHIVADLGF